MPHRSRGAPLKLCLVGDFLIERTVNCCKIASISLRTKIFADRDSARTGQGLCDPAPNGQFFRGSPRRRGEKAAPRHCRRATRQCRTIRHAMRVDSSPPHSPSEGAYPCQSSKETSNFSKILFLRNCCNRK